MTVAPADDGMAILTVLLSEILAHAIKDRLTEQAKQVLSARDEKRAPDSSAASAQDDVPDLPEVPDRLYEEFLRDLAADEDHDDGEIRSAVVASPYGKGAYEAAVPWEAGSAPGSDPASDGIGSDCAAGSGPASDRDGALVPDPACFDPIFAEDLSPFSTAAAEHDLLPSPELAPMPPMPPPDHDAPEIDEEREALFVAFADGFPEDPLPWDPQRLHVLGRSVPDGAIGAQELDERTLDQLRADLLADMLLCADPTTSSRSGLESLRARVQVTIGARTLAGIDERPAELDGIGPVEPDWVRTLAGLAPSLDRLFLDHRGMVTATDSYTPTANMKRFLRARDQHCRFPGCRAPLHRSQGDHNRDHAKGGTTDLENLAMFCTGHHPLKHPDLRDDDRWSARQLAGGIIEWTSPLGRVYADMPPTRVMLV
ncbi:HNH endonuclease signature motif containing protein [Microbacterium tumbae]